VYSVVPISPCISSRLVEIHALFEAWEFAGVGIGVSLWLGPAADASVAGCRLSMLQNRPRALQVNAATLLKSCSVPDIARWKQTLTRCRNFD
jgi:hypothetical protein